MTSLDPNRAEELAAFEARYWPVLQITLRRVFDADPRIADRYRRGLIEAPPLQRALALHDDPLDVAATLTGKSLTADRIALYDDVISSLADARRLVPETRATKVAEPGDILSSARRDEDAPMVTVITLNKFLGELGYHRLTIGGGVAFFLLERKAWKRPLPKRLYMETLPGLTGDREEVYGLDRILNVLKGLQEFARRRKPDSSIITRIEKIKARLLRTLTPRR
ncbi:hypothetical protein QA640_36955 [Bradyrhizobium sp. CB82]|uniref:hypothetical protein n=1 Tax=Bradyrhizobium sp. CB82 TaxID=3039159 RepID=UPI0024B19CD0|nr:hypothetical protein [Bradyrhizobium sp. CB82]WFU39868.1 hypothetical protein QA640_36955 [Bradyrhizobium sp. CB82]